MEKNISRFAYLIKVDSNANNNKFYCMIQVNNENYFSVEYGRIGVRGMKRKYPIEKWHQKFNEKLDKGYSDETNLYHQPEVNLHENFKEIENSTIQSLIERLRKYAKNKIRQEYTIKVNEVTDKMVTEAQYIINDLILSSSTTEFNATLVKLFTTLPRKIEGKVVDYLATSKNDFEQIIQKEQDLLDVMKGQIHTTKTISKKLDIDKTSNSNITILEAMGIEVQAVTPKEEQEIKNHLDAESAKHYKIAYKIINHQTEDKFQNYCKERQIKNTQFLFHGSRNENFWNILCCGMSLNPSAIITGKMYGHGLYFANKAKKSLNYTSLEGSIWTNGNSETGFLAVFKVAVGTPWDVYDWKSIYSTFTEKDILKMKKDSTFAHAGNVLRNDEIIVYNQNACTIRYLIELETRKKG